MGNTSSQIPRADTVYQTVETALIRNRTLYLEMKRSPLSEDQELQLVQVASQRGGTVQFGNAAWLHNAKILVNVPDSESNREMKAFFAGAIAGVLWTVGAAMIMSDGTPATSTQSASLQTTTA